jgi:hypothetical protein
MRRLTVPRLPPLLVFPALAHLLKLNRTRPHLFFTAKTIFLPLLKGIKATHFKYDFFISAGLNYLMETKRV